MQTQEEHTQWNMLRWMVQIHLQFWAKPLPPWRTKIPHTLSSTAYVKMAASTITSEPTTPKNRGVSQTWEQIPHIEWLSYRIRDLQPNKASLYSNQKFYLAIKRRRTSTWSTGHRRPELWPHWITDRPWYKSREIYQKLRSLKRSQVSTQFLQGCDHISMTTEHSLRKDIG